MSTTELYDQETEQQRIERWRAEMLERAGLDTPGAAVVASRHDIDLHTALGLLEKGCPPEIALRILL